MVREFTVCGRARARWKKRFAAAASRLAASSGKLLAPTIRRLRPGRILARLPKPFELALDS